MKNLSKLENEYDVFNKYIDEALGYLLKKQTFECMRVLETLKIFSRSIFNAHLLLDEDEE